MKDQTDWVKKWQDGETRFHQASYHKELVEFSDKALKGVVFVPLCGKSRDMLFIMSKGHIVVGVELSPIACREFFLENKIEFSESTSAGFTVFKSEKITLWCGDFFQLPPHVWKEINSVYDRAALVALPKDLRRQYVAEMKSRLQTGVSMLLISFEYPDGSLEGPPFSVMEEELRDIFSGTTIQNLNVKVEEVRAVQVKEICYQINF